jgi:hypothetical protein
MSGECFDLRKFSADCQQAASVALHTDAMVNVTNTSQERCRPGHSANGGGLAVNAQFDTDLNGAVKAIDFGNNGCFGGTPGVHKAEAGGKVHVGVKADLSNWQSDLQNCWTQPIGHRSEQNAGFGVDVSASGYERTTDVSRKPCGPPAVHRSEQDSSVNIDYGASTSRRDTDILGGYGRPGVHKTEQGSQVNYDYNANQHSRTVDDGPWGRKHASEQDSSVNYDYGAKTSRTDVDVQPGWWGRPEVRKTAQNSSVDVHYGAKTHNYEIDL